MSYFQSVGNSYANSIWEELLNPKSSEESSERFVHVLIPVSIDSL